MITYLSRLCRVVHHQTVRMSRLDGRLVGNGRRPGSCCRVAFVSWLVGLSIVAGTCVIQAQDVAPPDPEPQVVKQPKLLAETNMRISQGEVTGDAGVTIALGELVLTPDVRIEWNPRETLKDAKLTCKLTGRSLSLGTDEAADVKLNYKPDPITKENPAVISLNIRKAEAIHPGIYSGAAQFKFEAKSPGSLIVVPARWPITIVVPGRILKPDSVTFTEAKSGALHVGRRADVTVNMDTIGCDLGEGTIRLKFTPLGGQSRPLLTLPIPFEGVLDPLVDVRAPDYVCPEWQNAAVYTEVKKLEQPGDHHRYEITLHTGDCFAIGERIDAELTWAQSVEAPDIAGKESTATCVAEVRGGLIATPALAFDTETVHIQVVSKNDLGPTTCELTLIDPADRPTPLTLSRMTDPNVQGEASEVVYIYYAGVKPEQLGRWRVTWPESAKAAAGDAAQTAEFNVWGKLVNRLEISNGEFEIPMPVRVFASETPLFWNQIYGEEEGRGYFQYRLRALEIGIPSQFATHVQLRDLSFYREVPEKPGELSRWDAEKYPYLFISPQRGKDSGESEARTGFGSPEALPESSAPGELLAGHIDLPQDGLLPFDLFCSVVPVVGEHPRKAIREHDFVYRAMLTGVDGAGHPLARVVEFPFRVEVTDHWVYYKKWTGWIVLAVAAIVILGLLWWYGNREPQSKRRASSSGGQESPDEVAELFGGGSSLKKQSRGSAEPHQNEESPDRAPPSGPSSRPAEIDTDMNDLMDGFV